MALVSSVEGPELPLSDATREVSGGGKAQQDGSTSSAAEKPSTAKSGGSTSSVARPRHMSKYSAEARTMKPELLEEICMQRGLWSKPELNTQLLLNNKGFDAIANLEPYVKVRSLHLDNNNVAKIEGLHAMKELRSLHLSCNRLTRIEGLESNIELRHLELQCNGITEIAGLSHLLQLEHLNLANNSIALVESLEGLCALTHLSHADFSMNKIEASEGVVEFWSRALPQLKVFRYHGNPGARNISNYRKRLVSGLPQLTYLDERPVFPLERTTATAWAEGGHEAMQKAKVDFHKARAAECGVDPERREFLTRMRNLAIERIRREEENKRLEAEGLAPPKPKPEPEPAIAADDSKKVEAEGTAGAPDEEKVQKEEGQKEKDKVDTHKEALKEEDKAVKDGTKQEEDRQQEAEERVEAAQEKKQVEEEKASGDKAFAFNPPARGADPAKASRPSVQRRYPEAASFRVVERDHTNEDEEEHWNRAVDRQIAVMGDDPWSGTTTADKTLEQKHRRMLAKPPAQDEKQREVVPVQWEGNEQYAAREEERIMELNMAASRSEAVPSPTLQKQQEPNQQQPQQESQGQEQQSSMFGDLD